jgi:aspartyl-tRNA(Asn)/glutamyl-tRNA(Gln) amidotransferase subunit A
MTPLYALSAQQLLAGYRQRDFSPVEVMQSVLARIDRWEPQLCATYLLRPERALALAQQSEQRWMRVRPAARWTAFPSPSRKTSPRPVTRCRPARPHRSCRWPNATHPRRRACTKPARSWSARPRCPTTACCRPGCRVSTRWRATRGICDKTPGGSSAGAGAAAAAAYGPLHIGTDIGGSLRLPAGWCGIFSLKPSNGRIPIDPPYTGRAAGPMTRTVADAALMMQVLSQPDTRDSMCLPYQPIPWDQAEADVGRLRGLRIGLLMDAGCGLAVEPDIAAAVLDAARLLEQAGAIVEPMPPFMTPAMLDGLDHFWRMRSHVDLAALDPQAKARVLPYIRIWADSAQAMTPTQVFVAASQSHVTRVAAVAACRAYDYILSPTSPVHAAPAGDPSPTNDPLHGLEHIGFTVPYNMSEQPAASINCGYSASGMPIGLQIAGQRFDDLGVLQVSRAFELLRGPQRAWPEPGMAAT